MRPETFSADFASSEQNLNTALDIPSFIASIHPVSPPPQVVIFMNKSLAFVFVVTNG